MKKNITKIFAAILCMSIIMVVGCSNEQKNSPVQAVDPNEQVNTESPEQGDEEKTRIINTVKGEIEVPANPKRVVVNWYIGDVYSLGLNVVGYNAWAHETMPFFEKFANSVKLENWEAEDILKLEPDLIITYKEDDFDKFNKIAPVLVIPESDITSLERLEIIGDATGRRDEADTIISEFNIKLEAAKQKFKSDKFEGKSFSINEDWGSGSYGIYYETGSRGGTLLYTHLGLKMPEKLEQLIEDTGEGRAGLSYEVAADYFGDYIVWFLQEDSESEYAKTEIWKSIPSVKEGRVIEIPGKYQGLFYYSDVLSLTAQLDYIVDALNLVAQ